MTIVKFAMVLLFASFAGLFAIAYYTNDAFSMYLSGTWCALFIANFIPTIYRWWAANQI